MAATAASAATPVTEEELVRQHLPLVGHVVREFAAGLPAHVDRDDLTSAAMTALVKAARSFDPDAGAPFARWAALKLRGALLDELRSHDWASRSVRARARERELAVDRLAGRLGRLPDDEELARELGLTTAALREGQTDVHRAVVLSLSAPLPSGGSAADLVPADGLTPERIVVQRERTEAIVTAIDSLPERLRDVVVGYYLDNRPMAELAADLGVTESRVSQLRSEAISLLRAGLRDVLDGVPVTAPKPASERRHAAYLATLAARSSQATLAGLAELPRPRGALVADRDALRSV